jgi:hypothetical protein
LLGVNTDADRDAVRQVVARKGINWRSWSAGSPDGDIPARWHVTAYPAMFLIDAQGTVRQAQVHPGPELERAVDALLREAVH